MFHLVCCYTQNNLCSWKGILSACCLLGTVEDWGLEDSELWQVCVWRTVPKRVHLWIQVTLVCSWLLPGFCVISHLVATLMRSWSICLSSLWMDDRLLGGKGHTLNDLIMSQKDTDSLQDGLPRTELCPSVFRVSAVRTAPPWERKQKPPPSHSGDGRGLSQGDKGQGETQM